VNNQNYVAVIDFGSQTTMLIARRIRELGVVAKILPASVDADKLRDNLPKALILSGGPESFLSDKPLSMDMRLLDLNLPVLGICYGMQLLVHHFGGVVTRSSSREFGKREIDIHKGSLLFDGIPGPLNVWMSHTDQVDIAHTEFLTVAASETCPHAAIVWPAKSMFGVQFHPEVSHTEHGDRILKNFLFNIANLKANFELKSILDAKLAEIKATVADAHVIMGLSGGVDSTVAAVLIHQAIKDRLHCVYVNHGLHREGEIEEVEHMFGTMLKMDVHIVDAREQFMAALAGISDPELKRKTIGHTFIEVFEREAKRFSGIEFLGQGTLYPDVIESECKNHGPSHVIKSHHNVGGLPQRMNLRLLEPLRDLFKDEVRKLGALLGIASNVLMRQPFPGPGLAVRLPGEVTRERTDLLRKADLIVREEIERAISEGHAPKNLWQWFAILLPVQSVGVMGDARSYGETIVIRCVESVDAMTADWCKLPYEILAIMSSRITNEVAGISRVLYDITQKPPGTIEWE